MTEYNINNVKNDIENLQDQNKYDFQEIKRLDGLIKDCDKRVTQAINLNNQINKKIQDDYEKFKKSIMDDNLDIGTGGGGGEGLTSTQKQQLQTAYDHSQIDHVTMEEVNEAITNAQLGREEVDTTSFATDLSLTGSNLQLKNSQGKLIGNAITLPSTSGGGTSGGSGITPPEIDPTLRWLVVPETLQLTPGISKEITVTLNTVNDLKFRFGSNARILTFSGTDLFRGEDVLVFSKGETSKNITITANATDRKLVDYLYFGQYDSNTNGYTIIPTKTKIIVDPSGETIETYGNIVLNKTSETVSENSTTTFTVKLDASPTNNQTVNLSSNNSDVTLDKNSLVFTSSNYNVEQTVKVTIAKDSDYDDDTCKITAISPNVANVYLNLTITDVDESSIPDVDGPSIPSEPTGNVITDGLQVYVDGRDVEKGSTQPYWTNKVEGSSLEQIPIDGQFGNPSSSWNDTTKKYGWLGDSFRYYLISKPQNSNTIPNFDENTKEFTVEIGFLKEKQTLLESNNTVFNIFNAENSRISTITIQPKTDGTVRTYCGVNGQASYTDTSTDTTVKHYAITSNGDNTVSVYDAAELLTTLEAEKTTPFIYPFDTFTIAKGSYTQNVRLYYLRIYNRKLTIEEIQSNYQYESNIQRSVD